MGLMTQKKGIGDMKIKAGFRLEVTSWGNGFNNCKSEAMDGLTEEQVRELLKLFRLFKSDSNDGGVGNMYDPDEEELTYYYDKLFEVYNENSEFWNTYLSLPQETSNLAMNEDGAKVFADLVDNVLYNIGLSGSDGLFTRVFDSYEVTYTPVDVALENVTSKFKESAV